MILGPVNKNLYPKLVTKASESKPVTGTLQTTLTAYQKNLSNYSNPSDNETPNTGWNTRSVLSRISDLWDEDEERAQKMLSDFTYLQQDKTSKYYNPYSRATNQAVGQIAALGIDVSNIDDNWYDSWSGLKQYYKYTANTNSLSSTMTNKRSSPYEKAAYYYNQLVMAEDETKTAEQQWKALQEELTIKAQWKERNYSDEEIINGIDWSKYKMLVDMDEKAAAGTPIELNRPIGYSKDALYGVLWAARNGGSTGSLLQDMANSAKGTGWQYNEKIANKLNPDSADFSPYSVGSTNLDDAVLYFGVTSFGKDWCEQNKNLAWSNDETEKKMYQKVWNAEENQLKAEEELKALNAFIDSKLEHLSDPKKILEKIDWKKYPTLASMDKSIGKDGKPGNGNMVALTRGLDYRYADLQKMVGDRCAEKNNAPSTASKINSTMQTVGVTIPGVTPDTEPVVKAEEKKVTEGIDLVENKLTENEKKSFTSSPTLMHPTPNAMSTPTLIRKGIAASPVTILEGTVAEKTKKSNQIYWSTQEEIGGWEANETRRNDLEGKQKKIEETLGDKFAAMGQEMDRVEASLVVNGVRIHAIMERNVDGTFSPANIYDDEGNDLSLMGDNFYSIYNKDEVENEVQMASDRLQAHNEQTAAARDQQLNITEEDKELYKQWKVNQSYLDECYNYTKEHEETYKTQQKQRDESERSKALFEQELAKNGASIDVFARNDAINGFISSFAGNVIDVPDTNNWLDSFMDRFYVAKKIDLTAEEKANIDDSVQQIDTLLDSISNAQKYASENGIAVPQSYLDNMETQKAILERNKKAYEYYQLMSSENFFEIAEKKQTEVDNAVLYDSTGRVANSIGAIPKVGVASFVNRSEEALYYYLLATQGQQSAREYYEFLADPLTGVLHARTNENAGLVAKDMVSSGPLGTIGANLLAVGQAPGEAVMGGIWWLQSLFTGKMNGKSGLLGGQVFSSKVYEETTKSIEAAVRDNGGGDLGAEVAKGIYANLYNRGRSMLNAVTFGGFGGGSEILGAIPMAVGASSQAAAEATNKGASFLQAGLIGLATLGAESITEGIQLKHFNSALDAAKTGNGLGSFLLGLLPEGLSEAVGETLNDIVENKVDQWVMGALSDHAELVESYRMQGYMPDEAENLASRDEFQGYMRTAITSFFSPGIDLATYTVGKISDNRYYNKRSNDLRKVYGVEISPQELREFDQKQAEQRATQITDPVEKAYIADNELLTQAEVSEAGPRAVALASVLCVDDQTQSSDMAEAAASNIVYVFGDKQNVVPVIRELMDGAHVGSVDAGQVKIGIQMAALSENSQSFATMLSDEYQNASPYEKARMLAEAGMQDLNNKQVQQDVLAAVRENRLNEYKKQIIAEGGLAESQKKQDAVDAAAVETQKAEDALEDRRSAEEAAGERTQAAVEAVLNNPQNPALVDEHNSAVSEQGKRAEETRQYEQHLENMQEQQQKAETEAAAAKETDMNRIRLEAEQRLAEEDARRAEEAEQRKVEEEVRAKAEAAQRETNNVTRMDADDFIRRYFPNATDEEKTTIRDQFRAIRSEMGMTADALLERGKFARAVGKKFGVNITVQDTTQGGKVSRQNAYVDVNTGNIVLDTTATMDDMMYAVLTHELTHIAEKSGTYGELADALIRMEYGEDTGRLEADVRARKSLYDTRLSQMHEQDNSIDATPLTEEQAKQEIVADLMGKVLSGDQTLINNFVKEEPSIARRILDSIKSFLKKMVGIEGAPISQAQNVVNMLETALKDAQANSSQQNGKVKFSLKSFEDGKRFVDIDIMQNEFDNLSPDEMRKKARDIIREYFMGNVIGIDNKAFVNGQTANEYAFPSKFISDDEAKIKMRASTELDNLIDAGKYDRHEEDGRDGHFHKKVIGGFDYYKTIFKIGNEYFEGEVNIANLNKGKKFHDVTKIRNITQDIMSSYGQNPKSQFLRNVSMENVAQDKRTVKPLATDDQGNDTAFELPGNTADASPVIKHSLSSFTPEEQQKVREALLKSGRYTRQEVDKYLNDAMGIASMISADRDRLDFTADPTKTMLKPNAEYVKTLDASTLCAKRLLYQGTFNAIQHALPNTPLMPEDLIDLANMMRDMGYETPCGICYVESRRRQLGKFTEQWLESYDGEYKPTLDQVTTSDGLEELRNTHPQAYQDFINAMNKKGTMNPKVVQLRTDYRGEIRDMTPGQIQKVKDIGGLRVQSFSDFEVPHLLDMAQAVMDMAAKNLTAQAYTKVPNFPWAFGDTGIKINLSLIGAGTGVDENGNLVFDDVEGMPFEEAMKLRNRYSKNVGTILVGINDDHIKAAMADPRIDFIIPFHKSGWSKEELSKMPVLNSYSDYTDSQNEKKIVGRNKNGGYKTESLEKSKQVNFQPVGENGYWDFGKSGKENAEEYLRMCAEDGRLPKFSQFLVDNGDGSFSLQPDGSTDGYWKMLIDFKMYDNEGNGAPQQEVTPNINMPEAMRILNEYSLDRNGISRQSNNDLPVAQPVVDRYVDEYKANHPGRKYSLPAEQERTDDVALNEDLSESTDEGTHYGDHKKFSLRVQDQDELNFLNNQETIKTYKTMQLIDGKLYPPMAAVVAGSKEDYSELGSWEKATEHPELIKGGKNFTLNKGQGKGSLDARYNPYMHSSNLMINDQFSGAYNRPELVTVECEVPVSEKDSGYHAEFAKDSVGWHSWHTGTVAGALRQQKGIERQVFLSRWIKPVRIVPDSEVAAHYADLVDGTDIQVPDNVVYPALLEELKKAGVPIKESGKVSNVRYSLPSDAPYLSAVNHGDMEAAQQMVDEKAKEAGYTLVGYHGTKLPTLRYDTDGFGSETDYENKRLPFTVFRAGQSGGIYMASNREVSEGFAQRFDKQPGTVMSLYVKFDNPLVVNEHVWTSVPRYYNIPTPSVMKEAGYTQETLSTEEISEFAQENGYDGVIIEGIREGTDTQTDDFIAFGPDQIKLADPVTYDDAGNVIPLSERFNDQSNDIRYSLPSENLLNQQIRQYMERGGSLMEDENLPGNPLPEEGGSAQRQFGRRTAQTSDALHQEVKDYLYTHSSYTPDSNQAQIDRAMDWVQSRATADDPDGYQAAVNEVTSDSFDYRSADGQARMLTVMGMAALKNDLNTELRLADAYNKQGTDLGRQLQARKIFRLMTTIGRQATLQRMADQINDQYAKEGKTTRVKLSDWTLLAAGEAQTEEEFQRVQHAASQELAEQMPANWKDKLRGWRMLSMLGNPRTHIRNVVGNALFVPAVSMKNKLGAVMELGMEKGQRTKTLAPILSKEVRDFAKQDALTMKDTLTGEAKYNENSMVEREQKPFKGLLQAIIDFNSDMLEKEDWTFLKGHYKRALGGWMQANGYTAEQLQNDPALLEQGRAYAIQEAQKATYRDFNKTAQTLNRISRNGGFWGFLTEATLPFKKTPANILRRGMEYSPAGIMRSLTTDIYYLKQWNDYQSGKLDTLPDKAISPNQFIDRLCSGLSGTAIMAVGALLSSAGIVTCGLDDDDDKIEKEQGNQKYSIKFSIAGHDYTYTVDWAAPMAMPFFVGAAIQEQMADQEGFDIEQLINAFGNIAEPVFNLSMLDGVNTLFKTSQYDDTKEITQILAKIGSNYATSYIPSLLGAIARTVDDKSRKAFVEQGKGNGVPGTFRYAREQVENKIPGLSQTNIPIRDVFGNAKTSSLAERIFENFISPGYIEEYKNDPVLKEMDRLYGANVTDSEAMVPKDPAKSIKYKNQEYKLTAEQWDTYKATRGQTAYRMLTDMLNDPDYQNAEESAQVQMFKKAWEYADKVGKKAVIPEFDLEEKPNIIKTVVKDGKVSSYNANMLKSLESGDYEGYDAMVEALHQEGVEDSKIKEKIGDKYRDQYKDAYKKGDWERMSEIEALLDNTGFDFDLAKWEYDVDKKRGN